MNDIPPLRLTILGVVAVSLIATLLTRLWFLQIMVAPEYQVAAESNRIRTVAVEAPRGRILDSGGRVLADNRESVVVTVDPATLRRADDPDAVLDALARELTLAGEPVTAEVLTERIDRWNGDPFRPVRVAEDVDPSLWITLSERTTALPGVGVERALERLYPYGSTAAHVIGYVGEINQGELELVSGKPKTYRLGDTIGKIGVERIYEDALRGTPGEVVFEVDSVNRVVRILDETPPVPGDDVQLTIDVDLQAVAEQALADEIARARARGSLSSNRVAYPPGGALSVVDPRDGAVLAMASYPTFDPNQLSAGISTEAWAYLNDEANHFPLANRAIQGTYAPGSTFKLLTGYAAVSTGLRTPGYTIDDRGEYELIDCQGERCVFENSGGTANGAVDLPTALTVSSNVYFFQVGEAFWRSRTTYGDRPIQDVAEQFGLGTLTGIQLPFEGRGILIDPELRRARYEANPGLFLTGDWRTGDNVNLSIGQTELGVTPLQLTNAYATFGNGGTRYAPTIARRVLDGTTGETVTEFQSRVVAEIDIDPATWRAITDGLIGVTTSYRGTAAGVFEGFPSATFPVAGKTGTALVDRKADTSLFAAWAPADAPRYALSVIVEEAGFGSRTAAPIARRILEPLAARDLQGVALPRAPRVGETVEVDEAPVYDPGEVFD